MKWTFLLLLAPHMANAAAPPARMVYPACPVVLPEGHRPTDPLWYSWESTSGGTYALCFRGRQIGWLDDAGRYYPAVFRRGLAHFGPAVEPPVALPGKGVGQ